MRSTTNKPGWTSYLDSDSELCPAEGRQNSDGTQTPNTLIPRSGWRVRLVLKWAAPAAAGTWSASKVPKAARPLALTGERGYYRAGGRRTLLMT